MPPKKRKLSVVSKETREQLIEFFDENPYPSTQEKQKLASDLDIPISSVSQWFNKRRFDKKKKNETLGTSFTGTPRRESARTSARKETTPGDQILENAASSPESDLKAEKRSRYMRLFNDHRMASREHAQDIMDLQEEIMRLQQKLAEKMRLHKSETEMIDRIKENARVENIELSESDDDQSEEEDNIVSLLNIKGESIDAYN
ncbi:Oidioi.mRNA.OKI2018_I69.XSR.g16332.t1.cds [Oikopleura dioica]|uniref:Oidioi.mRNA.OKI2018_I69.XSR.g16332.t1.cds n=1 Tax=Oikopleura dioica TaxID=34765 RepID=A0ABN7SFR3_OIKDI|nr:Oidioi.mRNA.OKI2018_I69.XSR.g16332.t1.cds [Oikopleura dioica]